MSEKDDSHQGILRTERLSKDFGALRAVNQVNLKVESGVHSIIGPNGAGKTTFSISGSIVGEIIALGVMVWPPMSHTLINIFMAPFLLNFVPLSSLHWTNSGEVVIMTITGGLGTLFGPVLGAVGVILLRDIISNYTESWTFIMGILFMAAVLGFRSGLIGILRTKLRLTI